MFSFVPTNLSGNHDYYFFRHNLSLLDVPDTGPTVAVGSGSWSKLKSKNLDWRQSTSEVILPVSLINWNVNTKVMRKTMHRILWALVNLKHPWFDPITTSHRTMPVFSPSRLHHRLLALRTSSGGSLRVKDKAMASLSRSPGFFFFFFTPKSPCKRVIVIKQVLIYS